MKMIFSTRQKSVIKISQKKLRAIVEKIVKLSKLELGENQVISISFVGPRTIKQVNKNFVNHTGLTDVISFDYRDETLGDNDTAIELVIYPGMAIIEGSKRKKSSFAYEMVLYVVHGILHVAGENDLQPNERSKMRTKERMIIKELQKDFLFESIFQLKDNIQEQI